MPNQTDISSRWQEFAAQVQEAARGALGILEALKATIVEHFGQTGLYASYVVVGVLMVLLIMRLAKLTFSAVKYLVIPAVALAFIGSLVTNYPFVGLLPLTAMFCSLLLLFKG